MLQILKTAHSARRFLLTVRALPLWSGHSRASIAARLTQRQLAERIGVAEQQIQRWEANNYTGVNLDRLQNIAYALGVPDPRRQSLTAARHRGACAARSSIRRFTEPSIRVPQLACQRITRPADNHIHP